LRVTLHGPDGRKLAEYDKQEEGHYALNLSLPQYLQGGSYEIRITAERKGNVIVLRRLPLAIDPLTGEINGYTRKSVTKLELNLEEPIPANRGASQLTWEIVDEGAGFLQTAQIDRAVAFYQKAVSELHWYNSYELRVRTRLNYANSLHDAVTVYRYDYIAEAKQLYNELLKESQVESSLFWPSYRELGIAPQELREAIRDLDAVELQVLHAKLPYISKRQI
jgi:hypothetical protein